MILRCRIRHSRFECLSRQCKRWYFQIPGVSSANLINGGTGIRVLEKPNLFNRQRTSDLNGAVRFFGVSVQVKPKSETKDPNGPRLNNQITSEFVRLVTDEGHRIVPRHEALDHARKLKLDLVEVQRTAKPPVCKIMDYHREKYKQQVKEKDRAKSKSEVTLRKGDAKEVRFSGKTEQKDLQMKADTVKRLMEKGYRVRCMAMGTEDQDLGGLLSRLSALIEDVSVIESGPRVEKRQAFVIVRHIKFGPPKKGSGKKVAKIAEPASAKIQQAATSPTLDGVSPIQSPLQIEEDWELPESDLASEDDITDQEAPIATSMEMPVEELGESKLTWSVFDASDDFEKVFDFDDNGKGVTTNSTNRQMNSPADTVSPSEDIAYADLAYPKPQPRSAEVKSVPSSVQPRSAAAKSVPSSVQEPSHGSENSYSQRSEPRSRFQTEKSADRTSDDAKLFTVVPKSSTIHSGHVNRAPDAMDSVPFGPQSPNLGRMPQKDGTSPSAEQKRLGTDGGPKVVQPGPGTPSSPPPSYGIFSAPKPTVSGMQSVVTEAYREKERNSSDCTHSPNSSSNTPIINQSKPKAENSQKPEFGKTRQEGWGIFSGETSRNQNKNSDIQAKVQR